MSTGDAFGPSDRQWMRYALALAQRGRGHVEPNPMVGCVLVRDAEVIGEGYHQRYGHGHAEREALASIPDGTDPAGATWYVTLEPCCHQGKTPPCTDAIIASRPQRVVTAMRDPFDKVSGRGIAQLRQAGIDVEVGVCEAEAARLNAPFCKRVKQRRPWVTAKWAMTLDGRIATGTGHSQWISSQSSRQRVHQLRGCVDGIITGIGTVLNDDPMLTARPSGPRVATRIVLDRQARTPLDSQLVKTSGDVPSVIVCHRSAPDQRTDELRSAGCEVLQFDGDAVTLVDRVLQWCDEQDMTNVMLEAGGTLMGSFFSADAIDEYQVYVAAKLVGGQTALSPIEGEGLARITDSPLLEPLQVQAIDGDLLITTRRKMDT